MSYLSTSGNPSINLKSPISTLVLQTTLYQFKLYLYTLHCAIALEWFINKPFRFSSVSMKHYEWWITRAESDIKAGISWSNTNNIYLQTSQISEITI